MAQQVIKNKREKIKKVTSIGHSTRSMPKNKNKRRSWKRYKGQGKRR
ncbi:MAG: hypothetical protein HOC66_05540 [Flavobacteriales bacterium]|jgi:hypothetical protein|nr:hypothetical protein [Flavobacteriales bacterium]